MDQISEIEPVELSTIEEENSDQKTLSPGTASKISFRKDESYRHSAADTTNNNSSKRNSSEDYEDENSNSQTQTNNFSGSHSKQNSRDDDDAKSPKSAKSSSKSLNSRTKEKHKDKENNKEDSSTSGQKSTNSPVTHGRIKGNMSPKSIPSDCIILKLMIVTSDSAEFVFNLKTPASTISEYVWSNWPEHWPESQKTARSETLRLIYQGRFLHGNVTLGALRLVPKATSVMHLVHREKLPQATPDDKEKDNKSGNGNNNSRTGEQPGSGGIEGSNTCPALRRIARRICCCMNDN